MDRIRKFVSEVARRRVFATTALYIVAAWAVIQVADLSIEAGLLRIPLRSVFVAAFLGFPIALVVAWSYDITRKGIVRTPPADAPDVNSHNHAAAVDLALVLLRTGETERADYLLQKSLEHIDTIHRFGINGYAVDDVLIYTMQGRKDKAIATLRQAVDEGWRGSWWIFLELDPALDPLRDDPEFQSIVETIRADMAAQRQQLDQMRANGELPPIP
ncbi:MAG: hypothetical protein GTN98_03005 [Woeseiaceae bacterium]|nr:hypothetical protein [Woeseiaceae bacterium]